MDDPDVLVIGAGVVGLFCAYFLRRYGVSVTVVDRGEIGGPQSCSSMNTGFVGTQGAAPLAEPGVLRQGLGWLASSRSPFTITPRPSPALIAWLWRFSRLCNEKDFNACFRVLLDTKRASLKILGEVCAAGDLAESITHRGMIVAFKTEQAFDRACLALPQAVERGVPIRVLGAAELCDLEPDAQFDVHGALLNAEGAALAVPAFLTAFRGALAAMGVSFATGTQVTGFGLTTGTGGRRVSRVRTSAGDLHPGEIIIAAGAWSARCARMAGVRLMLQPAKGYTVTIAAPAAAPRRPVLLSEGKVALMPLGGRLRFGGTLELSGLRTRQSRQRVEGICSTVRSYLPSLEIGAEQQVWSGFRPCTPDSIPLIGRAGSVTNLSVACGHGYIGMGLAPAGGKLAAQLVTGQPPDTDPAPFRPGRFGGT
jgi:D-amino-acid dehydrogenase